MSEEARGEVITAVGRLTRPNRYRLVTVQNGDTLFGLINRLYRFYDRGYPKSSAAIASLIQEANPSLQDVNRLSAGQQLAVPVIPKRPFSQGADPELGQFLNLSSSETFTAHAVSNLSGTISAPVKEQSEPAGTSWIPQQLTFEQVQQLLDGLSDPIKKEVIGKSIYIGPTTQTVSITLLNSGAAPAVASVATPLSNMLRETISQLRPDFAGKYYILDVFTPLPDEACVHGEMVYAVAQHTLTELGAAPFKDNIVRIELDFFNNKKVVEERIKKFARSLTQDNEEKVLGFLRILLSQEPSSKEPLIPLLYLTAINFDLLSSATTSVISSSFWTFYDGFKWVPPEYRPESEIVLLSAVLNNSNSYIESEVYEKIEPLRTFWDMRILYGSILVGTEESRGKPYGMSSKDGDGITLVGRGFGWGETTSCERQNGGTSLATPHIGAQMLLARAFWKKHGMKVDAREAKIRLLLASEVVPEYINRYASAGILRIERLLRKDGAFGIRRDGSVVDIEVVAGAFLDYQGPNGLQPRLFLHRGKGAFFSGIQMVDNRFFIFSEAAMKWQEVNIIRMGINVKETATGKVMKTLEELQKNYSGVVML